MFSLPDKVLGPELELSVEEIVDYLMISLWRLSQFAFSSELAFRAGEFPYSVEHMAGGGQPVSYENRDPGSPFS